MRTVGWSRHPPLSSLYLAISIPLQTPRCGWIWSGLGSKGLRDIYAAAFGTRNFDSDLVDLMVKNGRQGHGIIPRSHLHSVREELLQFLLEESKTLSSEVFKGFRSSCGKCPNICYPLWMDTEATLEVVKCAFSQESLKPRNMLFHKISSLLYCLQFMNMVEHQNNIIHYSF